jgi:hypothetical protein
MVKKVSRFITSSSVRTTILEMRNISLSIKQALGRHSFYRAKETDAD